MSSIARFWPWECLLGCLLTAAPAAAQTDAAVAEHLRVQLAVPSADSTALHAQVQRFYASVGYAPVWTSSAGLLPAAAQGLTLLRRAWNFGLQPTSFQVHSLQVTADSLRMAGAPAAGLNHRARLELRLTSALIAFASQLRRGSVQPETLLPTSCAADSLFDPVAWIHAARRSKDFTQALLAAQPQSRSYVRLLWAWQRLQRADTAAARRQQWLVAANLQRLRWEPAAADTFCLVVNIPAYVLQVVRGTKLTRTFRVVVGGPATPTPELHSQLRFFQTSPEWKVPRSIATREMLPQLRRNPGYLAANNYVLYDRQGRVPNPHRINWKEVSAESFPYVIRQAATSDNALGNVVFRFPNPYDIFLHDTPARKLFSKPNRALSHGCIRLEKPLQLAVFLLRHDMPDKPERAQRNVERMWDSVYGGYSKYFPLRYPPPIYIRYLTCHADTGPELSRLPDVYRRDAALIAALQSGGGSSTATALE